MILFCDIDGVLLPGRAYFLPGQTQPIPLLFDPAVVGMVNRLCRELDAKVVVHSNWRNTEPRRQGLGMLSLQDHFVAQGILPEYMHADPLCGKAAAGSSRWQDIMLWLDQHPEYGDVAEENFWILEDTQPPEGWRYADRVIQTDFDEGLTVAQFMDIRLRSGRGRILLPSQGG